MELVQGFASEAISSIFVNPVIQLVKDVIQENENRQILQTDLGRMENLLIDINTLFQHQQKEPPESVKNSLQRVQTSLEEAQSLLSRYDVSTRQRCLQCVVCNPIRVLGKEIREWNDSFAKLYQDFQKDISLLATATQIASSASQHSGALLQNIGASGFVGSGNEIALRQVETWLSEGDHVRLIAVYGMAGVGKTSLQKMVYNKFQANNVFDHVIWLTVSQEYKILDLQCRIANAINLELPASNSDTDMQKMKLSAYLEKTKFLLVLDDLWNWLDLQELGLAFGQGKDSKVVFSTRRKDLTQEMNAEKFIEIQPLSKGEGWMLFQKIAFGEGQVPTEKEECARNIADECKGLPLALTVIAATMKSKSSVAEWEYSLSLMKSSDPAFPVTHPRVDKEVYQRLILSYDALPNSEVKNCFLYCTMYPEDAKIDIDKLVGMWISEGLVRSKQGKHLMDMAIGRSYVKLIVDRCLFQNVQNKEIKNVWKPHLIKVHDVIRDVAIFIGQTKEKCLFMAEQHFPEIQDDDRNRILLVANDIGDLPTKFTWPRLVNLMLAGNPIAEIPSGFLNSMTSLRILDLSRTKVLSIPSSVGQLSLLEFLALCNLPIMDLPEEICHLSRLQFLNLAGCSNLETLPSKIGDLGNLKNLHLTGCERLNFPDGLFELASLSTLDLRDSRLLLSRLRGFKTLTQLAVTVNGSTIGNGIMGTWSQMRHLFLAYRGSNLPTDMWCMSNLQSVTLRYYSGSCLPGYYVGGWQHLENLKLQQCRLLTDLYPLKTLPNLKFLQLSMLPRLIWLGIGSSKGPNDEFQRLEKLTLRWLERLEGITDPTRDEEWDEQTLPRLRVLKIDGCPRLKKIPRGMEKLPHLRTIFASKDWWENIRWEDENSLVSLGKLYRQWQPTMDGERGKTQIRGHRFHTWSGKWG